MDTKVLVAYASKYSATKEIAEKISQALSDEGFDVDVLNAGNVPDPAAYGAFIVGSASYIGQWRKEASKFVKANADTLTGKPVWIFSSGPTGEGDVDKLMSGWQCPGGLKPFIEKIKPKDIVVFHGKADPEKMNFLERWVLKRVKSGIGDFRNWDDITGWAKKIAAELKK